MLSSIHPLGERGKGNRFARTAAAFAVGATLGGSALGLAAGVIGAAVRSIVPVSHVAAVATVALVAIVGAAFEATGRPLPSIRRQVDENWLQEYRGWVYGLGFGLQLGAGVATYITSAAVYVVVVAAVLVGSVPAAVAIGATFGFVRGCSLIPARSIDSTDALVAFHRNLARTAPAVRTLSTVVLVGAGVLGAVTLL